MGEAEIARLLAEGAIQSVRADPDTARAEIDMARTHIAAALQIAEADPTLAFTGLYDGMRKAIQAHMRANGYRTTKGPGAHVKMGSYAAAALDGLTLDEHLEEFETLRVTRNQAEYSAVFVTAEHVQEAALHAEAIVEAVANVLGT